jgi:D-alanyl-D-alanine carboxypeptidase (penicillin-binding protein 5/6)
VTVYATLLGEPTRSRRNSDLAELLEWGLNQYRTVPVVEPGRVYATAAAPYGRKRLDIVADRRILRIVRIDRPLVERVTTPTVVSLPVERGQRLGEVRVYDRGKLIARSDLVAARSIGKPGIVGRVGWYAKRTLHDIWGWIS